MAAMEVEVGVRVFGLGEDVPRTCEVASGMGALLESGRVQVYGR
jgi:hypothetical protein